MTPMQFSTRKLKQLKVIRNFLSSLDTSLPMLDHFKNCAKDALLYKWDSSTVIAIMKGIERAYSEIKKEL